jgi:hypothetical protein
MAMIRWADTPSGVPPGYINYDIPDDVSTIIDVKLA